MSQEQNLSKDFYFDTHKVIRDLVHEYINVTDFELMLIDTLAFQRLKDIRQLTCQHVYPSATHTRFEHSLGVLELTRRAIRHLNKNGIIMGSASSEIIIDPSLEFNGCIAALLHDVGHCPFSHLGELEFNKDSVKKELIGEMEKCNQLQASDLLNYIENNDKVGSTHEQISCIVILREYRDILDALNVTAKPDEETCRLVVDYELIIRSILGIKYKVTVDNFEMHKKNIIVNLINNYIFDMDKLDYIMRDSVMTGIGTPAIDTKRLFRNIYLDRNYSVVFTSRAIPVLQNMIDSRDGLYLYVYNHHSVVFSDFMNSYIVRKLSHNAHAFLGILDSGVLPTGSRDVEKQLLNLNLGLVPKSYIFSTNAIISEMKSDSDWISLLNSINMCRGDDKEAILEKIRSSLVDERGENFGSGVVEIEKKIRELADRVIITNELIHNYKRRHYLKPWWKTVFEFSNFMNKNFQDDNIRKMLGCWICDGRKYNIDSAEVRSQIAKHVIYIVQEVFENHSEIGLVETLKEGEFFVIERSNRFFEIDAIDRLQIALKVSEIIGKHEEIKNSTSKYYIKELTQLVPQKNYASIYAKEGFYVFSKQVEKNISSKRRRIHYRVIEEIFVFVATELISRGEVSFNYIFGNKNNKNFKQLQERSLQDMLKLYLNQKNSD